MSTEPISDEELASIRRDAISADECYLMMNVHPQDILGMIARIDAAERRNQGNAINIVFDGPPGPEICQFVEVEDDDGKGIRVGEWIERPDGLWALRIDAAENRVCRCEWVRDHTQSERWYLIKSVDLWYDWTIRCKPPHCPLCGGRVVVDEENE